MASTNRSEGSTGRLKRALLIIVSLAVVIYASIFPIAELFTEVVVVRTYDASGAPHETRVTVIDIEGEAWVRGRPYRGWFRRIEVNPKAELYRGGTWRRVRAEVSRDPADAAAFEQVMLDTHGRVYQFLDVVAQMSSNEVPVRLVPREG